MEFYYNDMSCKGKCNTCDRDLLQVPCVLSLPFCEKCIISTIQRIVNGDDVTQNWASAVKTINPVCPSTEF